MTPKSSQNIKTTVTPYLAIKGAAAAIEFYKNAFGAREVVRLPDTNGKISHAEIHIGSARILISDEYPEIDVLSPKSIGGSPVLIILDVEDVDAVFSQALAAGATMVRPLQDGFDSTLRTGKLNDPFGHRWMITTSKDPEKLAARLHHNEKP